MSDVKVSESGHAIEVQVVEILGRGICPRGLQIGDRFRSDGEVGVACQWAAHTLLPFTTTLRFGGNVPWESEPGLARVCCPDPGNAVVFEVRRRERDA
jgi:uncharacterized repeat protein (TIGR04076 family)